MLAATHDAQTGSAPSAAGGPAAQAPTADAQASVQLAPLSARAIAAVLDMIPTFAAFFVIGNWYAVHWGGETASGFNLTGTPALVVMMLTGIVALVYYWLLEGTTGATIGKAIMGIRVRRVGGGNIDLHASLIRNLCRVVDGFFFYLVGWIIAKSSKLHQRLGDHLAHTVVVRDDSDRRGPMIGGIALAVVVVAAIVGSIAVRRTAAQPQTASSAGAVTSQDQAGMQRNDASSAAPAVAATSSGGSSLQLAKVTWLQSEGGAPRAPGPYTPGSDVYGAYELVGFSKGQDGHVDVAIRVNAVDPNGLSIAPPFPTDVRSAGPVSGPINGTFHVHLPEFVSAGTYAVRLSVHDNVSGAEALFTPSYTVAAPPVAAATALDLRNFRLSTTKDGDTVAHPVFHAGQTLYWSCEFAGIQFRGDQPEVHIDLALIGPDGNPLMSHPDWGTVSQPFVYHPPTFFLVVNSYITLPTDAKPGTYAVRLTANDRIAPATKSYDAHFDVQ